MYQSEGGGTVVMFAFGRDEGKGRVENVGVVLLRRVWSSKLRVEYRVKSSWQDELQICRVALCPGPE